MGLFIPLLAIAFAVLVVFILVKKAPSKMAGVDPEANLQGLPIVGCLFELLNNFHRMPDWILENTLKFNNKTWGAPLMRLGPLGQRGGVIVVTTEESVEYILSKNFENYKKGEQFAESLEPFFGRGIFVVDGKEWIHQRKVASHMFSTRLMKEGLKVAVFQGCKVLNKIRESANNKQPIEIQDVFFRFTIDTFCYIAFGIHLHCLEKDHPFAVAFDRAQRICNDRFQHPSWKLMRLIRSPDERQLSIDTKVINDFALGVISERRQEARQGSALGPDLVSRFLEKATDGGEDIADDDLRDVIINFIIAGRDTTACALSWTFYELTRHPDILARCQEEARRVLGDWEEIDFNNESLEDLDSVLTPDQLAALTYLQATISEVLRLHPSVPKQLKYAINDDVLPDGTNVAAGTPVIYSAYAMGRNPHVWDNPLEFRPERFLEDSNPSAYKYIAFNAGRRLCLGKPLAYLEIKMLTAMILSKFNVEIAEAHDGMYQNTLVLPMKGGIKLNFTERNTKA